MYFAIIIFVISFITMIANMIAIKSNLTKIRDMAFYESTVTVLR